MSTFQTQTPPAVAPRSASELHESAQRHLWMHFQRPGVDAPMIVRGDGCHVWDVEGRRYLDGLSALFCVNAGHGRTEIADAVAEQLRELAFYQLWGYTHPAAVALAERIAGLAPDGLERVFFTSGGSEAVESAIKLTRNLFRLRGEPGRFKIIARETAYHGTTLGALSATGIPAIKDQFAPMLPGACHVPNTNSFRADPARDPLWAADQIEERIVAEGPETVAAVILEPVQNAGGCFSPAPGYWRQVREICDRYGCLLIADEVISAWGRLGHWFGVQRHGVAPDLLTTAKGITSGYAPLGAVLVSDAVAGSFTQAGTAFAHGLTFAGHPASAAAAMANLDIFERENLCGRVLEHEAAFEAMLQGLRDLPIVGDVRGQGYFWALELVADQDTAERFDRSEHDRLLRELIGPGMRERGLLARADDRGDPVVQLCPPLIAGPDEFGDIEAVLRDVLSEAWRVMRG